MSNEFRECVIDDLIKNRVPVKEDIVDQLKDLRERFIFQGGSKFAVSIADEIIRLRDERARFRGEAEWQGAAWAAAEKENERLRQQVQELESIASEDYTKVFKALVASQAREAKLREVLEYFTSIYFETRHRKLAQEALALPQDDTALKEYRKRVRLEVADWFESGKCVSTEELRRKAEEE